MFNQNKHRSVEAVRSFKYEAAIKDDKFSLARNFAPECYVPNFARQQEKCTAIR